MGINYENLYITVKYNWTIINKNTFYIYFKTYDGYAHITYHKLDKRVHLNKSVYSYCDSFERANQYVDDLLKVYRWEIHERYKGRYFKLKKIMKHGTNKM